MALFGQSRDVAFLRSINRELMGNVITQQCSFYQYKIKETFVNMYGEASKEKFYVGPIIFNCLAERSDQNTPYDDRGPSFQWDIDFKFLRDDLIDAQIVPDVGDIILYNDNYYEVHNTNANRFFVGKDPAHPNEINPLNPGLGDFGWNYSFICNTHVLPSDMVGITRERV